MSSSPCVRIWTSEQRLDVLEVPSCAPYSVSRPSWGSAIFLHAAFAYRLCSTYLQMQFPQLFLVDGRGRVRHQVHRGGGLRERDHLANRALVAEKRRDTVEAERDAAMRRRAVLERLEEEAEAELRLLVADVEQREDPALRRRRRGFGCCRRQSRCR